MSSQPLPTSQVSTENSGSQISEIIGASDPVRFTASAAALGARSSLRIVERSRRVSWKRNSSGTKRARSQERPTVGPASSSDLTEERSSSTKSAKWTSAYKRSCSVFFRNASSAVSAARPLSTSTSECSRRQTVCWKISSQRGRFERTSTTDSTSRRLRFHH